ncbi:MAG: lipocalin family protein [Clostridia bacterium]|nr:lipocalin family protein [Clostridia bacterium]
MKKTLAILLALTMILCTALTAAEEADLEALGVRLVGTWLLKSVSRSGEEIELPEELGAFSALEFRDDWTVLMPYAADPAPMSYAIVDEYTLSIGEDLYSFLIETVEEEDDRLTLWIDYPNEPSIMLVYDRVESLPGPGGTEEAILTAEDLIGAWEVVSVTFGPQTVDIAEVIGGDGSAYMVFAEDGTLHLYTLKDGELTEDAAVPFAVSEDGQLVIDPGTEAEKQIRIGMKDGQLRIDPIAVESAGLSFGYVVTRIDALPVPEAPKAVTEEAAPQPAGERSIVGVWKLDRTIMADGTVATFYEVYGLEELKDADVRLTWTFTDDGRFIMAITGFGEPEKAEGTYTVDGSKLTVTVLENTRTVEFRFEGDELWIIEEEGTAVFLPDTAE